MDTQETHTHTGHTRKHAHVPHTLSRAEALKLLRTHKIFEVHIHPIPEPCNGRTKVDSRLR